METKSAIYARRTIHNYDPKAVISDDLLREGLDAALTAPNHKFTFPWKFVLVGPETREKLAEMSCQLDEEKAGAPLAPEIRLAKKAKILDPSALVVFCREVTDDVFRAKEDYATIACSIQNFCLYLASQDWGTKWSTGKITTHPKTYEVLGIDPKMHEIDGFVWVGKSSIELKPQKRPSLKEVLVTLK